MKKLILMFSMVLLTISQSYAWIQYSTTRSNGSWAGLYSDIQEHLQQIGTNCTFTLLCATPGWNRCRFQSLNVGNPSVYGCQAIVINTPGTTWYDVVNTDIEASIANGNTSGTMIRSDVQIANPWTQMLENAVVIWTYNTPTDHLNARVYSYSEAQEAGIIPPGIGG